MRGQNNSRRAIRRQHEVVRARYVFLPPVGAMFVARDWKLQRWRWGVAGRRNWGSGWLVVTQDRRAPPGGFGWALGFTSATGAAIETL